MSQWELPEGTPYTNWAGWSALLLGLIDSQMYYRPNWVVGDRDAFPEQLGTLKYILPLLAQCAAALEVIPMQFFVVAHTETQNTNGGTSTTDTYNKHSLNSEVADGDNNVALSSGDVVVEAGTWLFIGLPTCYRPNACHAALYNVSSSERVARGIDAYSDAALAVTAHPVVVFPMILSAATTLRLEIWVQTGQGGNGLGVPSNKAVETYAYLIGLKMS